MSYQTVNEAHATEATQLNSTQEAPAGRSRSFLFIAMVAVTTVVLGVAGVISSSGGVTPFQAADFDDESCSPCTFKECLSSQCDPQISPYVCTAGPSARGCAPSADTWPTSGVCDECCDMTDCTATVAAGGSLATTCDPCKKEDCAIFGGYQQCGSGAPYVCTSGSATWGCASDPNHWPAMEDTMCSSCCDMNSCWKG